jgi:phage host-nuclease inhibitor protein Gam
MKTKRQKVAAIEHWVPQTRDAAAEAVAEIGRKQRERDRIQAAMNDALAEARAMYEAAAKPHADRISELTRGLHLWCEANREALTQGNKVKFHTFATGEVKWRMRPPSIAIRGVDAVVSALRALKLDRFLRTKVEIDKEALLKEPDIAKQVGGVSLVQKEDFVVVPSETNLDEVAP